jgi:hypothetical protein
MENTQFLKLIIKELQCNVYLLNASGQLNYIIFRLKLKIFLFFFKF